MTRTYEPEYEEPDTLSCGGCGTEIAQGDVVSLGRDSLCPLCACLQASRTVADWLDPFWSPPPGALRSYQQAREVLTVLLARADTRAKAEGEKPMFGRVG